MPSASTITQILRRRGLLEEGPGQGRGPCTRFEDPAPNGTWQMDFKGHVPLSRGGRCHPLTVTDDHSRYCISLRSCLDEREATVRGELERAFGRYGLPGRILCDNGSPWGSGASREWTALEVWLLERGVRTTHGRVYHPQTQGKQERFHRTLKAEVLRRVELADAQEAQRLFDAWRTQYNTLRPHEALQMDTPSQRYRPSEREYTGRALDLGYEPGEELRKADEHGRVRYRGVQWRVGRAFAGRTLAVREDPWGREGIKSVCFGPYEVASLDVRAGVGVGLQGECERPRRGRRLAPLAAARDAE